MSNPPLKLSFEFALPGVLAVLWGSSYLFTRLALAGIPPLTLIATRVAIVALMVGIDVLQGIGRQVLGQLAALFGAMLYAAAAVYGIGVALINLPVRKQPVAGFLVIR
jgi:drug/metabolite transporter (DMT)-like permease